MQLQHNPIFANLPVRAVAGIIDSQIHSLLCLYSFIILANTTSLSLLLPNLFMLITYVWLPLGILYPLILYLLLTKTGYTPGKFICGIHLGNAKDSLLSFKRVIFREMIAKRVSAAFLMLGYLNIAVDPDHRAWHDYFTDSFVRNGSTNSSMAVDLPAGRQGTRDSKSSNRFLVGMVILLILLVLQVMLGNNLYNTFRANTNLQADIQFLIAPIQNLIQNSNL